MMPLDVTARVGYSTLSKETQKLRHFPQIPESAVGVRWYFSSSSFAEMSFLKVGTHNGHNEKSRPTWREP
jgi:hypothetical protein